MNAGDIMTAPVVSVPPHMDIQQIANLLLEKRISAVPVTDDAGTLVGIVSEGDLVRRTEIGTDERHRSWWLSLVADSFADARDYVKTHGKTAADVMTRDVVTADIDTTLPELAQALEEHKVKRLPIMANGKVVGIVSRANILQALTANRSVAPPAASVADKDIRKTLLDELHKESWSRPMGLNVIVTDGVVHYYGIVQSEDQRRALTIAAQNIVGVDHVEDHLGTQSRYYNSGI